MNKLSKHVIFIGIYPFTFLQTNLQKMSKYACLRDFWRSLINYDPLLYNLLKWPLILLLLYLIINGEDKQCDLLRVFQCYFQWTCRFLDGVVVIIIVTLWGFHIVLLNSIATNVISWTLYAVGTIPLDEKTIFLTYMWSIRVFFLVVWTDIACE